LPFFTSRSFRVFTFLLTHLLPLSQIWTGIDAAQALKTVWASLSKIFKELTKKQ
jgi:hypothetical protein